jgi:hypothetical protein
MKVKISYLILVISLSFTPSFATTPPKAGATCSKLGLTKSYLGKKFTCIKQGKKLRWDKGTTYKFIESPKQRDPEECKLAEIRFVTFFVDFSDAQGTEADIKFFREQERIFVDWFEVASYGKAKVEITSSDVWFRAKKKSSDLVLPQNNYGSHPLIAQELVELTGDTFDWRNIDAFMVHFPRVNGTNLRDAQLGRSVTLKFPHGGTKRC